MPEIERLAAQKCGYCSGWGHAGRDCATDFKLKQLQRGVREVAVIMLEIRTKCHKGVKREAVTGWSRLLAREKKVRRKKVIVSEATTPLTDF